MRKNRNRPESDEPLSEGRVEYLEAARQRVRNRRIRRTAVLLVLLTAVVLFATGIAGSSVAALKDLTDTARIALLPGSGWPQQTGVAELEQMAPLTGSFVELGDEGCVVWSRTGKKLNSIQSGYARPALAAGKTRFVLYNRSGNELRVESRTQNLYTKQLENSIFLCAMSDNGTLAVVTEDQTSMAKLLVYSPSMEQQLSWSMTSNDGTPLRMAFSPDSRKLAAAAVTVSGGQVMTNLYLINLASGDPVSLVNQGGVPQWLGWTSASTILAVYDTRTVLYNAGGGERAVYDFAGTELKDVSVDAAGNVALLLASGQVSQAVTLDKNLNVQFSAAVSAANSIVRAGNLFYLLADNSVECFDASGTLSVNARAVPPLPKGEAIAALRKKSAIYFVASPVRSVGSPFGGAGTTAVVTERVSQFGIRLNVCSRIRHLFLISYVRWSGWCWPSGMPAKAFWPRWCS